VVATTREWRPRPARGCCSGARRPSRRPPHLPRPRWRRGTGARCRPPSPRPPPRGPSRRPQSPRTPGPPPPNSRHLALCGAIPRAARPLTPHAPHPGNVWPYFAAANVAVWIVRILLIRGLEPQPIARGIIALGRGSGARGGAALRARMRRAGGSLLVFWARPP
jgi:hypothetical protein